MNKKGFSIVDAILEEGKSQFLTKGFRHVNIDELVQRVGISKTTFYKYFPSKDFLYEQTIENHLAKFHKILKRKIKEVSKSGRENFFKIFFEILKIASEFLDITSKLLSKHEEIRFPNSGKKIKDFAKKQIEKNFYLILNKGKELEIISSQTNEEILFHIINYTLTNISSISNKINNTSHIFFDYFSIIFNGILNDRFKSMFNNQIEILKYESH